MLKVTELKISKMSQRLIGPVGYFSGYRHRGSGFTNLTYPHKSCSYRNDDTQDLESVLIVNLRYTKTKVTRKFIITEHFDVHRKNVALRPKNYTEQKFFINY